MKRNEWIWDIAGRMSITWWLDIRSEGKKESKENTQVWCGQLHDFGTFQCTRCRRIEEIYIWFRPLQLNFIIFVYLISEQQLEENLRMERKCGSRGRSFFLLACHELNSSNWILPPNPLNLKFEITCQFQILEGIRYIRIKTLPPFFEKTGFPNVHTF